MQGKVTRMKRILVIDDDDMYRTMLVKFFRHAGYDAHAASNGKEGLRIQSETPADLVLTDLIMPEMEGIQTIIELTRQYPGIKIIAISGGGRIGSEQYLQMATRLGAQKGFGKPFKTSELLAAVQELLHEETGAA